MDTSSIITGTTLNRYQLDIPSCTASLDVEEFSGAEKLSELYGNDSNLLIVFYVQIVPDDFVMQLHRF